jgi:hypothetical protein
LVQSKSERDRESRERERDKRGKQGLMTVDRERRLRDRESE